VFLVGIVLEHSGHVAFAAMGMQQHEHGSMPMGADHAERWTLWMFTLMVAAMMIPATIGSIRTTAARSLWRRRQRAVAEFLVAFVGAWIVFGAVVLGVSSLVADAGWLELGGTATAVGFRTCGAVAADAGQAAGAQWAPSDPAARPLRPPGGPRLPLFRRRHRPRVHR
jgi:predicted metal-binding membrane protein